MVSLSAIQLAGIKQKQKATLKSASANTINITDGSTHFDWWMFPSYTNNGSYQQFHYDRSKKEGQEKYESLASDAEYSQNYVAFIKLYLSAFGWDFDQKKMQVGKALPAAPYLIRFHKMMQSLNGITAENKKPLACFSKQDEQDDFLLSISEFLKTANNAGWAIAEKSTDHHYKSEYTAFAKMVKSGKTTKSNASLFDKEEFKRILSYKYEANPPEGDKDHPTASSNFKPYTISFKKDELFHNANEYGCYFTASLSKDGKTINLRPTNLPTFSGTGVSYAPHRQEIAKQLQASLLALGLSSAVVNKNNESVDITFNDLAKHTEFRNLGICQVHTFVESLSDKQKLETFSQNVLEILGNVENYLQDKGYDDNPKIKAIRSQKALSYSGDMHAIDTLLDKSVQKHLRVDIPLSPFWVSIDVVTGESVIRVREDIMHYEDLPTKYIETLHDLLQKSVNFNKYLTNKNNNDGYYLNPNGIYFCQKLLRDIRDNTKQHTTNNTIQPDFTKDEAFRRRIRDGLIDYISRTDNSTTKFPEEKIIVQGKEITVAEESLRMGDKKLDKNKQEDASEFLKELLLSFHTIQPSAIQEDITLYDDKARTKKLVSRQPGITREYLLDIPLIKGDNIKFSDLIVSYQKEEQLGDDESVRLDPDDSSSEQKPTNKKTTILVPDQAEELFFTVKRFEYDILGSVNKIDTKINFDTFSNKEVTAFIVHEGLVNVGHYIAYIKHKDGWYCYNDDSVSKISDTDSKNEMQNAYIVKYGIDKTEKLPKGPHVGINNDTGAACWANSTLAFLLSSEAIDKNRLVQCATTKKQINNPSQSSSLKHQQPKTIHQWQNSGFAIPISQKIDDKQAIAKPTPQKYDNISKPSPQQSNDQELGATKTKTRELLHLQSPLRHSLLHKTVQGVRYTPQMRELKSKISETYSQIGNNENGNKSLRMFDIRLNNLAKNIETLENKEKNVKKQISHVPDSRWIKNSTKKSVFKKEITIPSIGTVKLKLPEIIADLFLPIFGQKTNKEKKTTKLVVGYVQKKNRELKTLKENIQENKNSIEILREELEKFIKNFKDSNQNPKLSVKPDQFERAHKTFQRPISVN